MAEILSFTRELNMSEDSVPMAKRIIQARTLLGVSQATFGEMAGLEGHTANVKMSQYETGVYQPKYNFVLKLAEVSGLPEFFFYIKDDKQAGELVEAVQNNEGWLYRAG
jgi:transcriptional regulator with XRE-family HTH domain